jgi:hypothetical protein
MGNFTIVAIFDSTIDNLMLHTDGNKAPFLILIDKENQYWHCSPRILQQR